ncbi:MAG: DNA-binding protein [Pseudomonadota bacterium]
MENDIRARIIDAANALYEEAARLIFPTVDAVRKRARVNMNDASTCMKEWRRAQTANSPVPAEVPAAIQQTNNSALAEIWLAAVTLANESLRAAQAGWDIERAESDTLAQQMANAFEEQAAELDTVKSTVVEFQATLSDADLETAGLRNQLDDALRKADTERSAKNQAEARSIEIERRASDLWLELDHAHRLAASASKDREAVQQRADREIEALRAELGKVKDETDIECARAQAALTSSIATAARLKGQIEALTMTAPTVSNGKPRRKSATV